MKGSRCFWMLAVLVAMTGGCGREARDRAAVEDRESHVAGYWEGMFLPESGMDLTLVLHFALDEEEGLRGRVLLWQGGQQIQDDRLSEIRLDGSRLRFRIPAKSTLFSGEISDQVRIVGGFDFPDGSRHAVDVRRVEAPGLRATLPPSIVAEGPVVQEVSRAEARRDLDTLISVIARLHPAPYRFVDPDKLSIRAERLSSSLPDTIAVDEFLRRLRPLVASFRCVHTAIRAPRKLAAQMRGVPGYLPLDARVVGGNVYVTDPRGRGDIAPGSMIRSIDGVPSADVIRRMIGSVASDGLGISYPVFIINRDFALAYAAAFGHRERFDVEFSQAPGETQRVSIAGAPHPELDQRSSASMSLTFPGESRVAHLAVMSFGPPDVEAELVRMDEMFGEIRRRGSTSLVLDVRGNSGGHPFLSNRLISHLVEEPYRYFTGNQAGSGDLEALYEEQHPAENVFGGQVVILMDGAAVSTTGHFLALAHVLGLGLMVGEEAGSTFWSNDRSRTIVLPGSGLEVNVPTRTFEVASSGLPADHGIRPDAEVAPGVEDYLRGADPAFDYALDWLRRN